MNIIKKRDKEVGSIIKEVVQKNAKLSKGLAVVTIEEIYRARMGKMVSSYTSQIYLKGNKLFIYIESAPLRAELYMSRQQLMTSLNEELGSEVIQEIIFK